MPASSKTSFSHILDQIRQDYPSINFEPDETFRWSSESRTVFYDSSADRPIWSLLHELGHMLKGHTDYKTDRRLVLMEVEAWDEAKKLAVNYDCPIDEDYVQDCLDSYRDWQHQRSTCPRCTQTGVEKSSGHYRCINCRAEWQVGSDRFCRVYRRLEIA